MYKNEYDKSEYFVGNLSGVAIEVKPQKGIRVDSPRDRANVVYFKQVKDFGEFVKIKSDCEELLTRLKDKNAFVTFIYLTFNLQCVTNFVVNADGGKMTIQGLARVQGVSRQKVARDLKLLYEVNAIRDVRHSGKEYICVNPYYATKGGQISNYILSLFKE